MQSVDPLTSFVNLLTTIGPTGILAAWLFFEKREKTRLQKIVERYLPIIEDNARTARKLRQVITGDGDD